MNVGVVIVNWNGHPHVGNCLDALERQTLRPQRIVVVDNASHDGSAEYIEKQFPAVEVIRLKENRGFAAANNLAFEQLDGVEWIALLNPDAFPEPDWLQRLVEATRRHTGYGSYSSKLVMDEESGNLDGAGDVYHVCGLGWRRCHGQPKVACGDSEREVFGACAAAALYKKSALDAVGGFDADYFCYFEDMDLSFRLRLRGFGCMYVPTAVARHVGSATTGKKSDFSVFYGHRNMVWTFFKNMPGPLLALYILQHILINIVSVLQYAAQGRGRLVLKAKFEALRGLGRVWAKRRQVQAARTATCRQIRAVMAKGLMVPYVSRYSA